MGGCLRLGTDLLLRERGAVLLLGLNSAERCEVFRLWFALKLSLSSSNAPPSSSHWRQLCADDYSGRDPSKEDVTKPCEKQKAPRRGLTNQPVGALLSSMLRRRSLGARDQLLGPEPRKVYYGRCTSQDTTRHHASRANFSLGACCHTRSGGQEACTVTHAPLGPGGCNEPKVRSVEQYSSVQVYALL